MMSKQLLIEDRSGAVALNDRLGKEVKLGALIGGSFFVLFLGWAALTPLDAGAYAHGVVEVIGSRQAVQHPHGGVVSAIYHRDGDLVKKGQPVLRLSSGDVESEEQGLSAEYYMLLAQQARLVAERSGASVISPPAEFGDLNDRDRALAEDALRTQQKVMSARRAAQSAQKSVLGQRSAAANEQIVGIGAERSSNREQRRIIEDEFSGLKTLAEKGYVTKTRLRALEREMAALDGQYGGQTSDIERTRQSIGEHRMQSLLVDSEAMKDVDSGLRSVALRLNEIRPRLTASREKLSRSVIRAPASGRIVGLNVFTVGGVVAAGETLMEIVPENRDLVIKARISPEDADDVVAGMPTEVRFSSIRSTTVPALKGTLVTFSADSLTEERTGLAYFAGEVRVPLDELKRIPPDRPGKPMVRPGLPAEILIPLRKRTMLQYLVEPLTNLVWRTGREH